MNAPLFGQRPNHSTLMEFGLQVGNVRRLLVPILNEHFEEMQLAALTFVALPDMSFNVVWLLAGEALSVNIPVTMQELRDAQGMVSTEPGGIPGRSQDLEMKIVLAMQKRLGLDEEDDE